jgi:hypothetical protein
MDKRGDFILEYLGDDSSIFLINQFIPAPIPPVLYVETVQGVLLGSTIKIIVGGHNIIGNSILTSYGMMYRKIDIVDAPWSIMSLNGALPVNNFSMLITGTTYGSTYEYMAFVRSGVYGYTGLTLQTVIPAAPVVPLIFTTGGTASSTGLTNVGGVHIVGYNNIDYYGMQYRPVGAVNSNILVSPTVLNFSSGGSPQNVHVTGDSWNTTAILKNVSLTWITTPATVIPLPAGASSIVAVSTNIGIARTGTVCYLPNTGTMKTVTVNQAGPISSITLVQMPTLSTGGGAGALTSGYISTTPAMTAGQCYSAVISWNRMHQAGITSPITHTACVECNGTCIYCKTLGAKTAQNISCTLPPLLIKCGDIINTYVDINSPEDVYGTTSMSISTVTSGVGNFGIGGAPIEIFTETPAAIV